MWQFVAVAAFEDSCRRDRTLSQPMPEEGEIFLCETHLSDRISGECIEAGRDEHQIRLEFLQAFQGMGNRLTMLVAWAKWRDGKIMDVACRTSARARITGKLVHGGEGDARIARDNSLSAVAMVGIEVPDPDPRCALGKGIERGYRNVIEITESHRLVAGGVMTRRSHQAERGSSA